MEAKSVLLFVIIVVLIYIVYGYISKDVSTLSGLTSGQTMQTINATSLTSSSTTSSNGVTYDWMKPTKNPTNGKLNNMRLEFQSLKASSKDEFKYHSVRFIKREFLSFLFHLMSGNVLSSVNSKIEAINHLR